MLPADLEYVAAKNFVSRSSWEDISVGGCEAIHWQFLVS